MVTDTIPIKGMHCKACVVLIEKKLNELDGVEAVAVDLLKSKVDVKYDSNQVSLENIGKAIRDAGYLPQHPEMSQAVQQDRTLIEGAIYGLIPHIGCFGFILFSILGVTAGTSLFKPLLMDPNFFYILIGISLVFATGSATFYLKRNGLLSPEGIRMKWRYLSVLYGTTIAINLILFILIFPVVANLGPGVSITAALTSTFSGTAISNGGPGVTFAVDIPCPGHAPLITDELKSIEGVEGVFFRFPNLFDVSYSPEQTSKEKMLELEVFTLYPAEVVGETASLGVVESSPEPVEDNTPIQTITGGTIKSAQPQGAASPTSTSTSTCGGSCGSPTCDSSSSGSCGGSCGGR